MKEQVTSIAQLKRGHDKSKDFVVKALCWLFMGFYGNKYVLIASKSF